MDPVSGWMVFPYSGPERRPLSGREFPSGRSPVVLSGLRTSRFSRRDAHHRQVFADEASGNAAFDPAEYLDVLIATGHGPYIYGDAYIEKLPDRALSDAERKQVLAVHWKLAGLPPPSSA